MRGKAGWSCLLFVTAVAVYAQLNMTADQVVAFIRSSIQLHHDDVKVASYVKKIKLSDRLEERRVEELEGMGAGPRTIVALRQLSTTSANLTVAPPPAPVASKPTIPPPDSVEQARILQEILDHARAYVRSLPDYMCVQVTRRHFDPTGLENWRLADTVQEQVSYVDHKEAYKVTMINGQAVANVDHVKLGGSTLSGDFGSIYTEIFDPETATEFDWDHWATLRGRRMFVFAFHVPRSRSGFTIYSESAHRTITAGYRGLVYADRDTYTVMRYKFECEDIPADFPIHEVKLDVNYDFVDIAGHSYVLPLKTDLKSRESRYMTWNEASFHLYRKFNTESTITFDTPDPIPDEKTQEEPAKPDAKDVKPPAKKQQ
jgi:hypothetical protein